MYFIKDKRDTNDSVCVYDYILCIAVCRIYLQALHQFLETLALPLAPIKLINAQC